MNRFRYVLLCCMTCLPLAAGASFFDDDTPNPCIAAGSASFEPQFTAKGDFSKNLVKEIASAKKSIRVTAREFMSKPVSEALIAAARRGVDLKVVLNKKDSRNVYSAAHFMLTMSFTPHVLKNEDTLFESYIVVDDTDVVLGDAMRFTDAEEEKKSLGSALVIHNAPALAKRYLADWQTLWDASEVMPADK